MKRLILRCGLSPGDIVMLTAAVRDLHHCYPGQFLTDVRTACPELWEHNPHVTELSETDAGVEVIDCSYPLIDESNQVPYHCLHGFTAFLNDRLGLAIKPTVFKGDIHLSREEKGWYSQVRELTGKDIPFWIVVAGGKYDVTVKWWEPRRYQQVVDHFRDRIQFVQIGEWGHRHPKLDGVIDLRGKTNLRELVRLVYHSDGVLCPVTAVMHLAAAVPTRFPWLGARACVVVAGGREPAHWEAYPHHQFMHVNGSLSCCRQGGCWKDRSFALRDGDSRDERENLCVHTIDRLPRCLDMISAADVIRRIELYLQGGVLKVLSGRQCVAARRGVWASRFNRFDRQPLNLSSAGLACDEFVQRLNSAAVPSQGRGIVICAGGVKYFTNGWICVQMLRKMGCTLPIELWHLGPGELGSEMRSLVEPLGVQCRDALQTRKLFPARRLKGWALKSYAILYCAFRELLFLDADNVPVTNPEYLFQTSQFRRTGAIFWPDRNRSTTRLAKTVWRSCGLRPPPEPEFESGQILLDKNRCWQALRLAGWFNEHSDFYYQYLHGDKETFHLAFRKLKQRYSLIPKAPRPLTGTLCQHDFDGRRVFQHRTTDKWELTAENRPVNGFWFEPECRAFLRQLRRLWDGVIR